MAQTVWRAAVVAVAAWAAGCSVNIGDGRHAEAGPTTRETRVVERARAKGAEMLRAEVNIGAGELTLAGGAKELLEAEFDYNLPELRPEVRYDGGGFRGRLTVSQSGRAEALTGQIRNRWNLKLAEDLPLDLVVRCGAGENRLDLRTVTLRSLEMHIGVGEVRVDLRNKPTRDYEARIDGGIGRAEVIVPVDVGVVAEASGGIGEINVKGMKREGGKWVNDAYGSAKTTIRLSVKGGIGEIEIRAE